MEVLKTRPGGGGAAREAPRVGRRRTRYMKKDMGYWWEVLEETDT